MEKTVEASVGVIALVRDLMFSSKITSTARATGVAVKIVRDAVQLGVQPGKCLIVDLNQEGAIAAAAQWGKATGKPVVGFVSHVDSATIAAAREAGINQVMARSQFVNSLLEMLQSAAGST